MSYFLESIEQRLRKIDSPVVLYTQNSSVDQTFCVAELLKYSLQQSNSQCILILTAENYSHYHFLCLKQGIKLEDNIKKGNLRIIDLFSKGISQFHEELPLTESLPKVWVDVPGNSQSEPQTDLLQFIQKELEQISSQLSYIIIDDLLTLLLLIQDKYGDEYGPQTHKLLTILRKIQRPTTQLHIMASHIATQMDELKIYQRTLGFLRKTAHCQVQVMPNSSGYSKDFDGQIFVELREGHQISKTKLIFKLENTTLKTLSALQVS